MTIRNTKGEQARRADQRPQDIKAEPPKPRTETQISASIRKRAEKLGVLLIRINSGQITTAAGHHVNLAEPGTSDNLGLISVYALGSYVAAFLAVEVKRPGNVPTDLQSAFLARVNAAGGIGLWATSADEFEAKLRAELARRGWAQCSG